MLRRPPGVSKTVVPCRQLGGLGLHSRSPRDFFDTLVALGFLRPDGDIYVNETLYADPARLKAFRR
jgi:hypothetical protein